MEVIQVRIDSQPHANIVKRQLEFFVISNELEMFFSSHVPFRAIQPGGAQNIPDLTLRILEVVPSPFAGIVLRGLETVAKTRLEPQKFGKNVLLILT